MLKLLLLVQIFVLATCSTLNIHVDQPGHEISPKLWGIFVEEINHGLDGGLYGELIQNRNLQPKGWEQLDGYDVVTSSGISGSISLSYDNPLNSVLTTSLRLDVSSNVGSSDRVGISNSGYWGIPIRPDYTTYRASFYAKSSTFDGPLTISIESANRSITTVYATATIPSISNTFTKYEVLLEAREEFIQTPSLDNIFIISANNVSSGSSIFFNMVSLFPPTWKNRTNGLRIDLAEKLAAAKPSFVRLPGGSFVEGYEWEGDIRRFIWEETIGDLEERPGHPGLWGYYASNGVGLLEYLQLCEDLDADIVLAVYAGHTLSNFSYPPDQLGPFVESAVNEIEYYIGNTSTTYGALRAAHGHPAPFKLTHVEIGNEDYFTNDYDLRYPPFYDAITEKYPELTIIATAHVDTRPVPVRDDHYFQGLGQFLNMHHIYDNEPRNGSAIFVEEYATRDEIDGVHIAHTAAAIEEAVFMAGLERNGDIVKMASYAPLFCNVNDLRWTPDAIYFDGLSSYASPAWYVQHLFSVHRGDVYIPTDTDTSLPNIFHVAAKNTATNSLILKIVNGGTSAVTLDTVEIMGIETAEGFSGTMTVLTGGRFDFNSIEDPLRITPKTDLFLTESTVFSYTAPATSLTIFEIQL